MNLIQNPSLIEQLAASYALGTLRGGARRRFEGLARQHAEVRAQALIWQGRMSSVAELQPQAAPSPVVWKRIENLVAADKEAKAMQATRAAAKPEKTWWDSLNLWRGLSSMGVGVAADTNPTALGCLTTSSGVSSIRISRRSEERRVGKEC